VNIHVVFSLAAAILYLLIAIFVLSQNRTKQVNRLFALMLLCVSLWQIEVAGVRGAINAEFATLWGKIFRNGFLFIPPTFLHFTMVFTRPEQVGKRGKRILYAAYGVSIFLAVINWTPHFTGPVERVSWGYMVPSGPLYPIFTGQFLVCVVLSFLSFVQGYIRSDRYQRQRLKYFLIAILVSFSLGGINYLPVLGWMTFPVGNIAIIFGLLIAAYSVVQHRLMEVSVFMSKSLGYTLSVIVWAVPVFFIILYLEKTFFRRGPSSFAIVVVFIGIFAILIFNFIKSWIEKRLEHLLVRDKYQYHKILEDFSRRLLTIVDLNRLTHMLAETIEKAMGVQKISLFLKDPEKDGFTPLVIKGLPQERVHSLTLKGEDAPISLLQERKEAVLAGELTNAAQGEDREALIRLLRQLEAEICLPLVYMNKMIGFISLGQKAGGEMYYPDDLDLLNFLGNQTAIAIENASLYENLKRSQSIMRRADRLAALGMLIASLAHEIRNPLVSIKTFTQLLPERIEDEEFRNYFLNVASSEIDRLTSLINELLGFARPSEPNLQGENVNEIIERIGFLIGNEARKKNVQIIKNYANDLPLILVDAEQIKQVLLNILLNAIQAIPGEGQIWIETRVVSVARDGDASPFVQIEIRDTGVGIPKENFERIFDPFFSTRPEGNGLGMAISNQIIHEHGGFIDLESEVGKGTSFRVHLPLKPEGRNAPSK
jgi:two-component system NtrC family sensor kinase